MGKISYSSQAVIVKGPSEIVDTVVKAIVDVDVSGKNTDFTTNGFVTLLDARNKRVEGLATNPGDVSVSLTFSPVVNKKMVEVKPNVTGAVAKGFVLNQIIINPEQIEISGDEKIIEKTPYIYTEPINIAGLNKETVVQSKIQIKGGILASRDTVTVKISAIKE